MSMKLSSVMMISALLFGVGGCKDETRPVEITETRRLTMFDDESVLEMVMPAEWRRVPQVEFRDFNYKFGEDGEVYLSLVKGEILENVNRWMRQMGKEALDGVSDLERVEALGNEGVLVEIEGKFAGMGGVEQEGMMLLGALVKSRGNLISLKMVGEADEVREQRDHFMEYLGSLRWQSAFHDVKPEGWRESSEAKAFREVTYDFGAAEGEVFVVQLRGDVLEHLNRWRAEYGEKALADISGVEKVELLNEEGILVELKREGEMLLGAMVESRGDVVAVKMTGGVEEVEGQRAAFLEYVSELRWRD